MGAGLMTFAAASVQADIGDLVSDDDFTYEVLTENKSSRTGTVSVICFNQESRPEIIIPEVAHCLNFLDGETVQYTYDVVGIGRGIVAWYDVPVTRFFIPKTIQFIPEPPIGNMVEIKGVEVSEDNPWFCSPGGLLMDKEQTRLIYYPQGKEGSFYEIPSTVKTIGINAFTWNETLTEINVPDTVTEIEFSAFGSCLNLEKIKLPASIKSLAGQMFWHCDFLKEVIIPEGVEEIGQGFFGLCMSLNKVEFPASVKSLGEEMFLGCTNLEGVYFNGNAPEAENIFTFWDEEETSNAIVYYRKGTTGWGPTFCGRPTAVWGDEEPATISCKAEGNVLVINYTGTLYQSTDTVNWTEVAGASSPYRVAMSEKMLFFRTQGGVPIYKNMTIPLGDDVELDMIWIDPGTFMMGSPENEIGRDGVEYLHSETIRYGFWLGKYEVTHEQYKAIMGENPSQFSGSGKPVETVSWYDAMSFCEKLTAREKEAGRLPAGYKYTLPTSAEWEYACRAGTTTAFNNGTNIPTEEQAYTEPCPNLDQVGWYDYNSNSAVHTVGQKKPNAWGLYDMHGNVNEWTSSKPEGREDEDLYIIRGGDWESWPYSCRSAYWHMQGPDVREYWYGFRVALTAIP